MTSKKKNQPYVISSYVQWNVYQHLKIFCEDYAKYKILDPMLSKVDFIKNLQFDNFIKMTVERPDKTVLLFFIVESDAKSLGNIIAKLDNDINIIYPTSLEKAVIKVVNKLANKTIDYINYNVFKLIVPKCPGAPKYRILSDNEADDICRINRCRKTSFNSIQKRDPMGRWYQIKSGDLIEVRYTSETNHYYLTYKYCK